MSRSSSAAASSALVARSISSGEQSVRTMTVSPWRISTRGRCGRVCRHATNASTNDAALHPFPVTNCSTSSTVPISPGRGVLPRTSLTADLRTSGSDRNQPCNERSSPAPDSTCTSNRTQASPPTSTAATVDDRRRLSSSTSPQLRGTLRKIAPSSEGTACRRPAGSIVAHHVDGRTERFELADVPMHDGTFAAEPLDCYL